MVYEGLNQKEATKEVGITPEYFSKWKGKNEEKYKELEKEYHREFMSDLVTPALQALKDLLKSENDNVRLNALRDILDRTGHKPIEQQEIKSRHTINTQETSAEFRKILESVKKDD